MISSVREMFRNSPAAARFVPLFVVLVLTSLQGSFGDASRYWLYLVKTLAGGALLWLAWPAVKEMRWKFSWEGIVAGVAIYLVWTLSDDLYPKLKFSSDQPAWNPHTAFAPPLAYLFIATRVLGSTLIIPPLEEVFYRSFLYRYLAQKDFLSMPLSKFLLFPFLVVLLAFAFGHREWLAALVCGAVYHGLILAKGRLGDAILAHSVTNFLLSLHVIWKSAWEFW